ncbi:Membrane-fusion protein [Butyrivibrio fibrisolvens 16/4]|nr:Membrane-fusion protein [Butyrivibrio fibrisolvens 16/4]
MLGFLKKIGGFFKKHIKLVIVIAIITAIVLYVRYSINKAKELLEEQMNQPVTATVEQMDVQKSVSVTGTLNATDTAKVTSTIGGSMTGVKVKKINYEVGDYVEKGAVVVEFDGDDYDRKISELNAQYNITNKESEVNIGDLNKKIADTQKQIEDDQKWLDEKKLYYDNLKDAYDKYLEHPNYDDRKERYESEAAICQSRYNFTIETYEAKRDGIKTLQDSIITYQNQIELAQLRQAFNQNYTQVDEKDKIYESKDATHVEAPISGYILTMNVTEGNNYAQGNTVFTIADTSEFIVEATVNEYDIAKISTGLPAKVKFESTGDETFDGEVTFVSLASEGSIGGNPQGQPAATGVASYKVKIKMKDNDDRMRVGMTAKASVILDSAKNVICVPYDCVKTNEDDGSFYVTVIEDDGTKKDIKVKKGLESDYYVEVKGDGLKKGMTIEAVVTDGPSTDVMDYITFD